MYNFLTKTQGNAFVGLFLSPTSQASHSIPHATTVGGHISPQISQVGIGPCYLYQAFTSPAH